MDKILLGVRRIKEPALLNKDRLPILLIGLSLIIGIVVAVVVGQLGWLVLIVLPAFITLVGAVSKPDLGLAALIVVIFAQLQRVVTHFHDLPGPGEPVVAFLIVVIVIRIIVFNETPSLWVQNSFIIGVYLFFLTISVVTAGEMARAFTEFIDIAKNLVIVSIILYLINQPTSLKSAIWAVIFAGILMSSISVYQNLTQTYDNNYWGFGGWEFSGYVGRPRMTGPYQTPNPYAQVLVVIFILALDRLWHETRLVLRLWASIGVLLCALALIYTDSRGGFANLVFTTFVFFLFNRPKLLSLTITLFMYIFLIRFLPSNYTDRILTLTEINLFQDPSAPIVDESFRGRTSENIVAWQMFLDHPAFGVGLNNYGMHYQEYSRELGIDPRRETRDPASLYLQLLADQGLVGTAAFILFFISVFVRLFKAYRWLVITKMHNEANIASALFAALSGYMFMAIYKNSAYHNVLWVLVAICISVTQIVANYHQANKGFGEPKELVA